MSHERARPALALSTTRSSPATSPTCRSCAASISPSRKARSSSCSAPTAPASRRWSRRSPAWCRSIRRHGLARRQRHHRRAGARDGAARPRLRAADREHLRRRCRSTTICSSPPTSSPTSGAGPASRRSTPCSPISRRGLRCRRAALRRPAADAGGRARADRRADGADARRAVGRPVAEIRRRGLREAGRDQPRPASPSCWSSRTSRRRSPSPTAP